MTKRTIAQTSVRIGVGVVALALGAGVVFSATALPIPKFQETPAGRVITPVALDQQRVCPGSLLRLAGDSGASATTVTAVGRATTVSGSGDGDTTQQSVLAGADGAASSPLLITAPAAGTKIPLVGGAESQQAAESDLGGFAAAPCAEPTSSTWLVGGSTTTGRTTLIDLINPTDVNSTVDLSLAGENGPVEGPGLEGIVVGPRSQKVIPLSGFATDLSSPVVHVSSRGGQITATLQTSVVRTLEPGGVDIVSAAAAPSRLVTVPGIIVRDGAALQAKVGSAGYDDLKTILRTFVPGKDNAQLSVQMSTSDGKGATFSTTAQAGQVTDLPLDGLAEGIYTATIQSNVPVVAGARSSSVAKEGPIDLAWTGGAPALTGTTMFSTAKGVGVALDLANPTSKAVVARLSSTSASGKTTAQEVTVPAGSSVVTGLDNGATLTLTKADGLRGAVNYAASGRIASYALFSPTAASTPVKVYP
jgi:hypothetical protein